MQATLSPQDEILLKERMLEVYYDNPLAFVLEMFPWGEDDSPLYEQDGPDTWQVDVLNLLGKSGDIEGALRVAVASGHGIGKTALVAWVILWFISTRRNPQIVVTASTGAQLANKTWRELAKWQKLSLNGHWFEWTATKFYLRESPQTWFAAAIPWSEHNSEAFAGTHEENVLVVFDEASGIADIIWEVTEGAMTTPGAVWVCFGNPTKNTGRFRECFGKFKHRWQTMRVDSRTAKMADNTQLSQWIEDYGIGSDFVKVRILGEFPSASTNQLIASDLVDAGFRYEAAGFEVAPTILAVDVARFGDDQTVLCIRQGRKVLPLAKFRGLDTMATADKVVQFINLYNPQLTVIDSVGIGAGVVDRVRQLGYVAMECNGGERASDDKQYANLRAEMWCKLREALKDGIDLPVDQELRDDLIGVEYAYLPTGKLQLEKKEDMKRRGLSSPDCADALAMTYAFPVRAQDFGGAQTRVLKAKSNYLMD